MFAQIKHQRIGIRIRGLGVSYEVEVLLSGSGYYFSLLLCGSYASFVFFQRNAVSRSVRLWFFGIWLPCQVASCTQPPPALPHSSASGSASSRNADKSTFVAGSDAT